MDLGAGGRDSLGIGLPADDDGDVALAVQQPGDLGSAGANQQQRPGLGRHQARGVCRQNISADGRCDESSISPPQ